jgi:hypothetical protein
MSTLFRLAKFSSAELQSGHMNSSLAQVQNSVVSMQDKNSGTVASHQVLREQQIFGPVPLTPYSACFFSRNHVFLSQQFSQNIVFS